MSERLQNPQYLVKQCPRKCRTEGPLSNRPHSGLCKPVLVYSSGSHAGWGLPQETLALSTDSSGCHHWEGLCWHRVQSTTAPERGAGPTTENHRHNMPTVPASGNRSAAPPLQTYHLVHGVAGVVVFRVGAADPHGLQQLLLLLFVLVRQRLLQLLLLDGGISLLFARALAVTPPVFFFFPTSSLLLPTWGATSKGGEGG